MTCRTSSTASTGRPRPGPSPAPASASPSSAGSPRCTAEPWQPSRGPRGSRSASSCRKSALGPGDLVVGDQHHVSVRVVDHCRVRADDGAGGRSPVVPGRGEPGPDGVDGGVVIDDELHDLLVAAVGAGPRLVEEGGQPAGGGDYGRDGSPQ